MVEGTNSGLTGKNESGFDGLAWLSKFERLGGHLMIDDRGESSLIWQIYRNTDENRAELARMVDDLSDQQAGAVVAARMKEAEHFRPDVWCRAFEAVGGDFHVRDGRPWAGAPEQDDERALRLLNRLVPAERAQLRHFLTRQFNLETVQ